jgi:tyrosine-protein kinase Etk/Wzc
MRVLPNTEKQLLEIQRQQAIKQQLYLYLLQKREEAALSLSVTVANNREIEPARFVGQVSPKSKQIQLFSLSAGLFLPILLLLIWNGLNKHVMSEDQILSQTSTPIIGTIPNIEIKLILWLVMEKEVQQLKCSGWCGLIFSMLAEE